MSLFFALEGELDQLESRGPFQPKPVCDSFKNQLCKINSLSIPKPSRLLARNGELCLPQPQLFRDTVHGHWPTEADAQPEV